MAVWTDEQLDILRKCWDEGLTATQIIARLDYAFSRSSILGKANRLNLKPRRAAYGRGNVRERQPHHKPKPPRPIGNVASKPLPPPPPAPPIKKQRMRNKLPREFNDNVFFANWISNLSPRGPALYRIPRDRHCKYILGNFPSPDAYWCGKDTDGSSWCPYHKKLVYIPLEQHRRRR